MSVEKDLVEWFIDIAWDELHGEEEYEVDKLTDLLNDRLKKIKQEVEEGRDEE